MIFKTKVKNHSKLKKDIIEELIKAPGSLLDTVQKTDWKTKVKNKPYVNLVMPSIKNHITKLINHLYGKNKKIIQSIINNIWYQIYTEASHHGWHTHAFTQFANVYFVELPNSKYGTEFLNEKNIKVNEGEIITFPSWYLHRSPVIKSNKRKIIIAFNLDMENLC